MISSKFGYAVVAVIAAVMFSGATKAATPVLIANGEDVGGWKIVYPEGTQLLLYNDDPTNVTVVLEKFATFTDNSGKLIQFIQDGAKPQTTLTIANESITNLSGTDWNGFDFLLVNHGGGTAAWTQAPGDITPFTTEKIVNAPYSSDINLSGGIVPNGSGFNPGDNGDGAKPFLIGATASFTANGGFNSVFTLKEIPNAATVPLPAAAWTGLSGLAGLVLIGTAKKLRKIIA